MCRFYCCTPQRPGVVPATCPGRVRFFAWNHPPAEPHIPQQQQQGQQQQGRQQQQGQQQRQQGRPQHKQQDQGPSQSNMPTAPSHQATTKAAAAAAAAATTSADTATGDTATGDTGTIGSTNDSTTCEALVVHVPVPYDMPPSRYAHDGSDRPWCWDEHFQGVDRFGSRCQNLARQLHR